MNGKKILITSFLIFAGTNSLIKAMLSEPTDTADTFKKQIESCCLNAEQVHAFKKLLEFHFQVFATSLIPDPNPGFTSHFRSIAIVNHLKQIVYFITQNYETFKVLDTHIEKYGYPILTAEDKDTYTDVFHKKAIQLLPTSVQKLILEKKKCFPDWDTLSEKKKDLLAIDFFGENDTTILSDCKKNAAEIQLRNNELKKLYPKKYTTIVFTDLFS